MGKHEHPVFGRILILSREIRRQTNSHSVWCAAVQCALRTRIRNSTRSGCVDFWNRHAAHELHILAPSESREEPLRYKRSTLNRKEAGGAYLRGHVGIDVLLARKRSLFEVVFEATEVQVSRGVGVANSAYHPCVAAFAG